ncbi:vascular endothelial zinc finger 1 [Astyanax mexicanus]|uniref:Vascular endothelial zinc finger 1-like n=1 Tax=Astyanax mexicanus TaxID=7994 RepID=A0A8T2L3F9_ASTMX|nr:vascular endothelial zinc finger 1 [Astyanax mexicanus]KAG9264452.1 vascular endothelial zinc finger 1-like [Astyanax mexicanus]
MDAAWSNFLFQTPPSQSQTETTLQSDLLPELTDPPPDPPAEHIAPPPSTVDTAALSEEPEPVKPVTRPPRPAHICSICNKQFKNSYNLRRHQSVHTGVKMKDRAAREKDGGKPGTRVERQTIPLSLLHLSIPATIPTATDPMTHPQPAITNQQVETVAVSITPATVAMTAPQPLSAAVVVTGTMVQAAPTNNTAENSNIPGSIQIAIPIANPHPVPSPNPLPNPSPNPNPTPTPNPNPIRKNHACEACGKAFRDVYHLNRHRLSHSDEKPYSCPICQQRFKRKDRMSYHVRSHQGGVEKPYVCPHCAKGFSRPDHLNSHVRQVHSTERPFKCPTCESAFATKDRLRAHMIRHEDKVPCHICGKLLSPAYITDHMRVHNQSQHHVCHLCNRSFTTLTYLRVHAQKHHGQEWKESSVGRGTGPGGVLLCQLCGVHCKTPTQLQGHMAMHANQTDPAAPSPISSSSGGTVTTATPVSSPPVTVGLLVTDCSSIAPQSHS